MARGLFPTALADEGLEAALESFAESSSISMTTELFLARPAVSVEAAAFFAVVYLADASRSGGRIFVRVGEEMMKLRSRSPPERQDLTAVEDRVGHWADRGGHLRPAGQSELPCAS